MIGSSAAPLTASSSACVTLAFGMVPPLGRSKVYDNDLRAVQHKHVAARDRVGNRRSPGDGEGVQLHRDIERRHASGGGDKEIDGETGAWVGHSAAKTKDALFGRGR